MDFRANQWLAELENDDVGEPEFIDPLSMQQLVESLANELWSHPHHQKQEEQDNQRQQCTYRTTSPTGFSFVGDMNDATEGVGFPTAPVSTSSSNCAFSFAGASSCPLNFPAQEQRCEKSIAVDATRKCCPLSMPEKKGRRRATSSVQEHVIAERKRREKMHHQFATLASIIPDITKTDKVSLLDSTIEYLHKLRDRLKALQEERHQSTGSSTAESRCGIRGVQRNDDGIEAVSLKVEVDVQGRTVLLRVVCREKKGVLVMVLTELEKHGLSVVNTNVVPFAESALNITITAQIEAGGSSTTVELVKTLNLALTNF